jgi:hypothetical protein
MSLLNPECICCIKARTVALGAVAVIVVNADLSVHAHSSFWSWGATGLFLASLAQWGYRAYTARHTPVRHPVRAYPQHKPKTLQIELPEPPYAVETTPQDAVIQSSATASLNAPDDSIPAFVVPKQHVPEKNAQI